MRIGEVVLIFLAVLVAVFLVIQSLFVLVERGSDHLSPPATLRIGSMDSLDSLNPYVGIDEISLLFYGLVYDGLQSLDNDLRPVPNLALGWWKVPANDHKLVAAGEPYGSVWEYNLTRNATWHDGQPFSAEDVVFNINLNSEHYCDLLAFQPYAYFMKEAEQIDNYTIRIHFWDRQTGNPMPVSWGDFIPIPMLPRHLLEDFSSAYIGMNWTGAFSEAQSPGLPIVGTGPFIATKDIFSEWVKGYNITLVKNLRYHWKLDKGPQFDIKFDKISLKFFDDSVAMVLALENREIEVAKFPPSAYQALMADVDSGRARHIESSSRLSCNQGFVYLSFLMKESGPNLIRLDPAVRRAMAMAIDKTDFVDQFFHGLAVEGSTIIPPSNTYWHYEPTDSEKLSCNITAANETLESAGYIDDDSDGIREATASCLAVMNGWVSSGTELALQVPVLYGSPYIEKSIMMDMGRLLKSEWAKIGVNASVFMVENVVFPTLCPIEQDVSLWYWSGMDPDPNFILFAQSSRAIPGWSDTSYSNSSYDDSYNSSVSALSKTERKMHVDSCQRMFYEQCPYIVLAYPYSNYGWRNDSFHGWGDWSAHPGRSLDDVWGANPLLFDLTPVAAVYVEAELSPLSWFVSAAVAVAVAGAVTGIYRMWKLRPGTEEPPKKEEVV